MYDSVGKIISKPDKWLPFSFVSTICLHKIYDFSTSLRQAWVANILVEHEGLNELLMSWLLHFSYLCQYNVKTLGYKTTGTSLRSRHCVCIWHKEHSQNTSCVHDFLSLLVNFMNKFLTFEYLTLAIKNCILLHVINSRKAIINCVFLSWFVVKVIVICATWIFYFGLISSFSPHYYWIIALRCLVGFGIGGAPQS